MSTTNTEVNKQPASGNTIGIVKWFNNKTGFGFVTALNNEYKDTDIFTHFSSIASSKSMYKYLVQGEYIEFSVIKTTDDKHEFKAGNITGIMNGPLMCETRSLNNTNNKGSSSTADEN
jgi:cold shock CspA family protein